jgi:hypothetical protein
MIYIGQGFLLLDFEPKPIHHSKPIIGKLIREHQHHSKANQTPSSLRYVERTRGANTFPLCNQSLALESLKDQLGFLITIILSGNSLIKQNKNFDMESPLPERVVATPRPARGCDKYHIG